MKCFACLMIVVMSLGASFVKRVTNADGETLAVIVPHDMEMSHVPQFGLDDAGQLQNFGDVKLNIVAADMESADAARKRIAELYPRGERPAVSIVLAGEPRGKKLLVDVVGVRNVHKPRSRIFISGQAEKGATPSEAAVKTMTSLIDTMKRLGLERGHVLHVKCFLNPMSARSDVINAVSSNFKMDVSAFVEWKSELPLEIELVADGPAPRGEAPAIEYLTPPGKTASPFFARVVRVNHADLLYIGDLYAESAGNGEQQVLSIFDQLDAILKQSKSDMRHLVKATYYVSDADASKQLNVLRPRFYDPARPPAASKAMVPGIGMRERTISIDMIAIPSTQPAPAPAKP